MLKVLFSFLILIFISNNIFAQSITIAVAANVSYAIDTLKKEFQKENPDIKVHITLGSSGKLTAQIKNGAPYDLFLSANMKYPEALYNEKKAITKPVVYAKGVLVLLSSSHRSFHKGINLVDNMLVKRVVLANPLTAPYGKAAKEALINAGLYEKIEKKIIYAESASQAVAYTLMGADVGFIAKSSLYTPKMKRFKKGVYWIDVDSSLYTPIEQGVVILKSAEYNKAAKKFYQFILSKKAKIILTSFGYE